MSNYRLKKIYFIVNANSRIGFGHLKRCLLLAKEFNSKGIETVFLSDNISKHMINEVQEKHELELFDTKKSLLETSFHFINKEQSLLIIDTDDQEFYESNYQKSIYERGIRFMYITIKNNISYYSHFLLNPNIIALATNYETQSYTRLMLGPKYFILDDNFKEIKPNLRQESKTKNILLTFGSADPNNLTYKLLSILERYEHFFNKLRVVAGGLNTNVDNIKKHKLLSKNNVEIYIDTKEMYKLMSDTDLAITSMGLTFWELTLHKVPCIAISGSEREKPVLKYIGKENYCYNLGDYDDKDWEKKWQTGLDKYIDNMNQYRSGLDKLYDHININGKTDLINQVITEYEKL
ncbi:UDP-2,4-diacetamido-2,4,6-trideoxy-beta-L-altropyranose hydrolase [Aquimarina sp. MMG016]|uniref:UDP-2,4-diacetamido-2,4, 6-trideoxy-beta-L-altropyranose hydrolase n=1 Tax=Aquimarina sp. MMG016 TaxID=2822690 RepID=UPI001B3A01D9|nr:UDP-2,4-diacetamido-2,4,6-trideoxy-beta-L-altropyranose hydrolase [Aquimarina sp. MMG016]MBQ4820077.1 UDP-2,4-diacetamido-2,4,6-trideoxy-beta-L-altropyranose hydrolase [Aquimarina sp. MMG016]